MKQDVIPAMQFIFSFLWDEDEVSALAVLFNILVTWKFKVKFKKNSFTGKFSIYFGKCHLLLSQTRKSPEFFWNPGTELVIDKRKWANSLVERQVLSNLWHCNFWSQPTPCEKNVSILVFAGLCRSFAYSLGTTIIFPWILKKNESVSLSATFSSINSDDFHWLFCQVFSLQFCGCKMWM